MIRKQQKCSSTDNGMDLLHGNEICLVSILLQFTARHTFVLLYPVFSLRKRGKTPPFLFKKIKGDQQSDYSVYPCVGVVVCFLTAILID
jgi:hypothetical protein